LKCFGICARYLEVKAQFAPLEKYSQIGAVA